MAAILVLLFHADIASNEKLEHPLLNGLFAGGYVGVDFFFVLSGFIIFYVHYQDIGEKRRLMQYVTKRFYRIYPIYWTATLLFLPAYFFGSGFGTGHETEPLVIAKSLLLIPQEVFPVLSVAWTLSYELMFYLIFGVMIYWGLKRTAPLFVLWMLICSIFYLTGPSDIFVLKFLFSAHNLEFGTGILAGVIVKKVEVTAFQAVFMLICGSVAFVISTLTIAFNPAPFDPIAAFAITSLFIIVGCAKLQMTNVSLSRMFNFIGDSSYSLYLVHIPISAAVILLVQKLSLISIMSYPVTMSLIIGATYALSCLFYIVVEKPMLNWIHRTIRKTRIRRAQAGKAVPR